MIARIRLQFCLGIIVFFGAGCSLEPPRLFSRLVLDLSPIIQATSRSSSWADPRDWLEFGQPRVGAHIVPDEWASFVCYGVNVVGPGIPDSAPSGGGGLHKSPQTVYSGLLAGSSCSYRGIVSSAVSPSSSTQEVELQVPTGPGRIVQVLGSTDAAFCSNGFTEDSDGGGSSLYELGRVQSDIYGDRALSIPVTFDFADPAAKAVDCGDGESCVGLVSGGAGAGPSNETVSVSGGYTKFAQKMALSPGDAISKVELTLGAAGGSVFSLGIYSDATGSPSSSLLAGPVTVTLTATGSDVRQFDFRDATFPRGYLVPSSGIYWLVVTSSASSFTASVSSPAGVTDEAKIFYTAGPSWGLATSGETAVYSVQSCE